MLTLPTPFCTLARFGSGTVAYECGTALEGDVTILTTFILSETSTGATTPSSTSVTAQSDIIPLSSTMTSGISSTSSSMTASNTSPASSNSQTASITITSSSTAGTPPMESRVSNTATPSYMVSLGGGTIAGVVVESVVGLAAILCPGFLLLQIHRMQKKQLAQTDRMTSQTYPYQNRYVNPQELKLDVNAISSPLRPPNHPRDNSDQSRASWTSPSTLLSPSSWVFPSGNSDRNRISISQQSGGPCSPEGLHGNPHIKRGLGNVEPAELSMTDLGGVGPVELPAGDIK